jgi:hypothetical protein
MAQTNSTVISDYTLNKKSANIEYRFVNSKNVPGSSSYSADDFLADYPGKTIEDYESLKKLSDGDYHAQKLTDYNTTHLNWNIEWAEQKGLCFGQSPEDILIAQINAEEYRRKRKRQAAWAKKALAALTAVQRRRYILHVGYEMTTRAIAEIEGVKHPSVVESITSAKKKIQKIIDEG